jgi:hypothetical protein
MKVMKLAETRDEALRIFQCLHELVRLPLADTLDVMNGMTYSMFLECIIRTAYDKLEENGEQDLPDGYKNTLEEMFNATNIELKKRMMDDRLISELYSHDNCKVFYQHSKLLHSIFFQKSTE